MELDGQLYVESADIMRLLEEAFTEHSPLLPPAGSKERSRADSLMRLERRLFSDWLSWLCQSWCAAWPWCSLLRSVKVSWHGASSQAEARAGLQGKQNSAPLNSAHLDHALL